MTKFKLGDRVEAIDDIVQGIITKITLEGITMESDEGFELWYKASELLPISGTKTLQVSHFEVAQAKAQKELPRRKNIPKPTKNAYAPTMEVDLHIGQLVASTKGMGNYDILNLQLETAKRQLAFAMQKRIQKIVFIHGVGEGVLKEELHYFLNRYENLKFYDADYQKYGLGATEVYIFQNP